jgi:hypothetical protein
MSNWKIHCLNLAADSILCGVAFDGEVEGVLRFFTPTLGMLGIATRFKVIFYGNNDYVFLS